MGYTYNRNTLYLKLIFNWVLYILSGISLVEKKSLQSFCGMEIMV